MTSYMYHNCGRCSRRSTKHVYPSRFGAKHEVYGRCDVCGAERLLSNTTHARFLELGGVCSWLQCRRRAVA